MMITRFAPRLCASLAGFALLITNSTLLKAELDHLQAFSTIAQRSADSGTGYLEGLRRELGKRLQFAAHRNNDRKLWAEVRDTLNHALYPEWRSGRLKGDNPSQAYYVHCDRSTMTQADLDEGQLVVIVGVAPIRPAEFQIIRLTQRTTPANNRVVWNQGAVRH
jgi:hypothetical protein